MGTCNASESRFVQNFYDASLDGASNRAAHHSMLMNMPGPNVQVR